MDIKLQELCELFVENSADIKRAFSWDSHMMAFAGSSLFTALGQKVDIETLKRCEEIVSSHSGALSGYRTSMKLPLLCKMAASSDPEQYFADADAIYQKLNEHNWLDSNYRLLASLILCDYVGSKDATDAIRRTDELMQRMKEAHSLLTSDEDIPFAALLAVSDLDSDALIAEAERCYPIAKEKFGFGSGEAVHTLSHVLALSPKSAEEKCRRVAQIYDGLKTERHKLDRGQELACLGMLAMLDVDTDKLVEEIVEIDNFLKAQKGDLGLDTGSSVRRMFAAFIAMDAHRPVGGSAQGITAENMLAVSVAIEICTATVIVLLMF